MVKVASPTTSRPRVSASFTNCSLMPVEYTSSFFQMIKTFSPRPCSVIYWAEARPWLGSEKHIW